MDRDAAQARLARFHEAQGAFYAGASDGGLRDLLTDDVEWHVPGENAIAGDYRGAADVMAYFARRRDLATRTFTLHPGEVLLGDGDHVAVMTDGTAVIGGRAQTWSTLGLYRFRGDRVAACWLLALDPRQFDAIWQSPDE